MFDIKVNFKKKITLIFGAPFCKREDETFDYLFACNSGVFSPTYIQSTRQRQTSSSSEKVLPKLKVFSQSRKSEFRVFSIMHLHICITFDVLNRFQQNKVSYT